LSVKLSDQQPEHKESMKAASATRLTTQGHQI
jgi:hypothetical protein